MLDYNHRPGIAERVNAAIDAALIAEREATPPRTYLGASRLGHACERALQFEFAGAPKDEGADFGGYLADTLLVDAADDDYHLVVRYVYTSWCFVFYFVAKAKTHAYALMAQALIAAHEELEEKDKRIAELTPDAEFARAVCVGKNCRTTTSLSKDYGLSAEKLNSILHGLKIQYKTSDGQWVLYAKYSGKGYTKNRKSTPFQHKSTGEWDTKNTTVWTEAGQRFIYEQLKAIGLTPSIDHNENVEQTTFERGA